MNQEQKLAVETDLCKVLKGFHDLEDKKKRYAYSKEYFFEFCKEHQIDPREAFNIVEEHLRNRTNYGISDYTDSIEFLKDTIQERD